MSGAVRGAELVALASAHGVDLKHVELNGSANPRHWDDGVELEPGKNARFHRPAAAGLGFAACGLPDELPWLAARFSFAADERSYWPLWWGLVFQAQRMAWREGWPPRVRTAQGGLRFYLLDLAQLVLDEEAARPLFAAAPRLRALCLDVEPATWDDVLEPRYRSLRAVYARWLDVVREMIGRWCAAELQAAAAPAGREGYLKRPAMKTAKPTNPTSQPTTASIANPISKPKRMMRKPVSSSFLP